MAYSKVDGAQKGGREHPGSLEELGRRIEAMLETLPNREEAARISGRARGQLYKYTKGQAEPPFLAIAALAMETGTSMEWLATGTGEMQRQTREQPLPYNEQRMRLCMKIAKALADNDGLEEGYTEEGFATALYGLMMRLPPANRG
jgi:hypothetical protein